MDDREFVLWIHERLEHVHGEDPHVDYMRKLRCIARSMDGASNTPNDSRGCESLDELRETLTEEVT